MLHVRPFALPIGLLVFAAVMVLVALAGMHDDAVMSHLQTQRLIAAELPELAATPKNEAVIAAERRWQREFREERARLLATVRRINARQPLVPDLFPNGAAPQLRAEFARAYYLRLAELLRSIRAGTIPTPDEVAAAQQDLDEWQRMVSEEAQSQVTPRRNRPVPRPGASPQFGTTSSAACLAALQKSRQIQCYADLAGLCPPIPEDAPRSPTLEELWFAQVTLWIQEDVLGAIAGINAHATASGPGAAGVAASPIKRIGALKVHGYFTRRGTLRFDEPERTLAGQRKYIGPAFTRSYSDEFHDVVEWQLLAVVDSRDVLALIDALSRRNLHCCIAAQYGRVEEREAGEGYCYGSDPVIRVNLEFETYFGRGVLDAMTPPRVVELVHGS